MKITGDRMQASAGPVTSILTLLSVLEPVFLQMPGGVFATESAETRLQKMCKISKKLLEFLVSIAHNLPRYYKVGATNPKKKKNEMK